MALEGGRDRTPGEKSLMKGFIICTLHHSNIQNDEIKEYQMRRANSTEKGRTNVYEILRGKSVGKISLRAIMTNQLTI